MNATTTIEDDPLAIRRVSARILIGVGIAAIVIVMGVWGRHVIDHDIHHSKHDLAEAIELANRRWFDDQVKPQLIDAVDAALAKRFGPAPDPQ